MFVLFSLLFYARSRRLGLEIKKRRPGWVGKISPTRRQQQLMTDDNIFFFTHLYSSISYIAPSKISYCSGGFHLVARSSVRLLLHDGSDDDETQYKCARQSSQKNLHFLFQKLYCNAPELLNADEKMKKKLLRETAKTFFWRKKERKSLATPWQRSLLLLHTVHDNLLLMIAARDIGWGGWDDVLVIPLSFLLPHNSCQHQLFLFSPVVTNDSQLYIVTHLLDIFKMISAFSNRAKK